MTCCAGLIPSELGKLSALQKLSLHESRVRGESNVCLGVPGTFVVSGGGNVSKNVIHDVEDENGICLKLLVELFFLRTGSLCRERRKVVDTLELLFLDFSGNRVE